MQNSTLLNNLTAFRANEIAKIDNKELREELANKHNDMIKKIEDENSLPACTYDRIGTKTQYSPGTLNAYSTGAPQKETDDSCLLL